MLGIAEELQFVGADRKRRTASISTCTPLCQTSVPDEADPQRPRLRALARRAGRGESRSPTPIFSDQPEARELARQSRATARRRDRSGRRAGGRAPGGRQCPPRSAGCAGLRAADLAAVCARPGERRRAAPISRCRSRDGRHRGRAPGPPPSACRTATPGNSARSARCRSSGTRAIGAVQALSARRGTPACSRAASRRPGCRARAPAPPDRTRDSASCGRGRSSGCTASSTWPIALGHQRRPVGVREGAAIQLLTISTTAGRRAARQSPGHAPAPDRTRRTAPST